MRVLLLADNLGAGGKERRLMALIKGFTAYPNVNLHLVVFSDRIHFQEVYELGIPITIIERIPKKNPIVFYRLFKLCRAWKPDIVHSWSSMCTILAIPTCFYLKIKLINANIADAPGTMKIYDRRMVRARLTFPFSNVILGNSQAGLIAYKVPNHKRVCIYNGFDTNRVANLLDEIIIKERFQIHTEKVVGMVGSFNGNKDYQTYIEAGIMVLKKGNDVTFIAVGEGTDRSKCQEMIPAEFASRFIFTGLQTNVESIINVFDIGVLSTNTKVHGEGISNAILEYMALKKPVIATIGGGTNEVVQDGNTGFLIPPYSPKKMADKLNYLLNNEFLIQKMGQEGGQRLESIFGIQKMIQAYNELYHFVVKQ